MISRSRSSSASRSITDGRVDASLYVGMTAVTAGMAATGPGRWTASRCDPLDRAEGGVGLELRHDALARARHSTEPVGSQPRAVDLTFAEATQEQEGTLVARDGSAHRVRVARLVA